MTFTAILPDIGFSNVLDVSQCSVAYISQWADLYPRSIPVVHT